MTNVEGLDRNDELLLGVPGIAWPFLISGAWCIASSLGFLVLSTLPYKMPVFYNETDEKTEASKIRIHHWKPLLGLTFFYFFIACGIERIYQPMAYTYGICGPLELTPSAAVIIDQCYNGGFMTGRLSGNFVSKFLKPRTMIVTSLFGCLGAAITLVALGAKSVMSVYAGTCFLGFFVSWQFGACYSWIAQKGDITGRLAPLFLVGCGVGSAAFPPLTGFVFTSSWGPMGVLQLTLIMCCVQILLFVFMWTLSRKAALNPISSEDKERIALKEQIKDTDV